RITLVIFSAFICNRPRYWGSSSPYSENDCGPYGSRMYAVPYSTPPSTPIFSGPIFTQSSPSPNRNGKLRMNRSVPSTVPSELLRIVSVVRTGSRPCDCSSRNAFQPSTPVPRSVMLVMPQRLYRCNSFSRLARYSSCETLARGSHFEVSAAASSITPVGSPLESLTILPPFG